LFGFIKKIFLWEYARNTWQWDILCVLILAFIFLTPKSWFEGSQRQPNHVHRNPATTLLLGPEVIKNESDTVSLQHHVRLLSGRTDAEIVAVRRVLDKNGNTLGYQVDIR
jgi:hypothetical protein